MTSSAPPAHLPGAGQPAFEHLDPESYTAQRLKHGAPSHLHRTARRFFVGPIPEGWLNSHRKAWYQDRIRLSNYSSRTATFSASVGTATDRQTVSGFDEPLSTTLFTPSFRQPDDVVEDEGRSEDGREEVDDVVQQSEEDAAAGDEDRALSPDSGHLSMQRSGKKAPSFVTAREHIVVSPVSDRDEEVGEIGKLSKPLTREQRSVDNSPSKSMNERLNGLTADTNEASRVTSTDSRTNLLPRRPSTVASRKSKLGLTVRTPAAVADDDVEYFGPNTTRSSTQNLVSNLVKFNLDDNIAQKQANVRKGISKVQRRADPRRFRRQAVRDGEILKMEKMLVRIDVTLQQIPSDYDENDCYRMELRTVEKWTEFMVVCRESKETDVPFVLQLYKTRVIPEIDDQKKGGKGKRPQYEIPLRHDTTKVNLFSSLDKTCVLWHPFEKGSRMYIMGPRSAARSVEWYTFLRDCLGWNRPSMLQIAVPDLSISIHLENPFEEFENARKTAADRLDAGAMVQTFAEEQAVSGRLIKRCMDSLSEDPEWADVVKTWAEKENVGLCWKRYDRLEWVHGANEQKMYGSMAMQKNYQLELRPKQHYPCVARLTKGDMMEEPLPVEGFLIRLTSQKGRHQRMGKMFFKRLYYYTHNQYLCFTKPAKARPPPPPKLPTSSEAEVPSSAQIVEESPLVYCIDPYPLKDDEIPWLSSGNSAYVKKHDEDAFAEWQRNLENLTASEGYISLCNVVKVRSAKLGSHPVDENIESGSDVEFHVDVPNTNREDGATNSFDDERTLELVLKNGLVIRLQAFNAETKDEWVKRLKDLVRYWRARVVQDMDMFKLVRKLNLEQLGIDEVVESAIGQFAKKWEVSRSEASPQLYHLCGMSLCRPITISGLLYHKPRRHGTFQRCSVILTSQTLLLFQSSLRSHTGVEIPHIHQERVSSIDLRDCYVYSGLVADDDLLYSNRTFDANHVGTHALPRVYLDDGWTSSDEEAMKCFVIWRPLRKSFFRARERDISSDIPISEEEGRKGEKPGVIRNKLRQVSALGVPGRSIVFQTRSRAERDHWVLALAMEIDRLKQDDEYRVVST